MLKILYSFITNILSYLNINISKSTKKIEVVNLISSLYPIKTEHKLIRIGSKGDGGYLLPDDLKNISALFSPGVDQTSEFERHCLTFGMKIFMADKSVDKPNLNLDENQYSFIKKFVSCYSSNDFITMDGWVNSTNLDKQSELMLQMDIEGSEYECIVNMSDSLMARFRIIVIEFHNLQDLWSFKIFSNS
jgi:hypothetical protein